jgi:arsenate reductase
MSESRPEVLFLCVHNAGRSQMPGALLTARAGGRIGVHSAGSGPGETLNPAVVKAVAELGLDIGGDTPKRLTDEMALWGVRLSRRTARWVSALVCTREGRLSFRW